MCLSCINFMDSGTPMEAAGSCVSARRLDKRTPASWGRCGRYVAFAHGQSYYFVENVTSFVPRAVDSSKRPSRDSNMVID